jgi:hypothetical protein
MKTYGRVEVIAPPFYVSKLDGSEWSASRRGCFTPRETAPATHYVGGLAAVQYIKSSVCGATAKNNINHLTGVYIIGLFMGVS